jgi:hypothetical protein
MESHVIGGCSMLRILMAVNAIAGTIIAAVGAYYTAAQYYGWKPNSEGLMAMLPDVWPVAVLAIGVMLIVLSLLQAFGVVGGSSKTFRTNYGAHI